MTMENETVLRLVEAFMREHPHYAGTINRNALERSLQQVQRDVLSGNYLAKTEDQLAVESNQAGIERNHYLDLVNLTAHACANRPLET